MMMMGIEFGLGKKVSGSNSWRCDKPFSLRNSVVHCSMGNCYSDHLTTGCCMWRSKVSNDADRPGSEEHTAPAIGQHILPAVANVGASGGVCPSVPDSPQSPKQASVVEDMRGIIDAWVANVDRHEEARIPVQGDAQLSVKVFPKGGDARALAEVLEDFEQKVANSPAVACQHAYLMARVDTGFHVWGIFVEKQPCSRQRIIFFDSAHTHDALDAFDGAQLSGAIDAVFMVPLKHTNGPCNVLHQLVLQGRPPHNVCGVMAYFALRYFLLVGFDGSVTDVGAFMYTRGETVPRAVFDANLEQYASCRAAAFTAAAYPAAFSCFSEYGPLGALHIPALPKTSISRLS